MKGKGIPGQENSILKGSEAWKSPEPPHYNGNEDIKGGMLEERWEGNRGLMITDSIVGSRALSLSTIERFFPPTPSR